MDKHQWSVHNIAANSCEGERWLRLFRHTSEEPSDVSLMAFVPLSVLDINRVEGERGIHRGADIFKKQPLEVFSP